MSMVDKEKLARLAQALDDRADNKVAKEAERAAQAEADLQAHSNATRDMLGGKSLRYLTQAEYDILSEEEKQNEHVIYYITDLEDRTHDHYNKEVLDIIDDMKNSIAKILFDRFSRYLTSINSKFQIALKEQTPNLNYHRIQRERIRQQGQTQGSE